MANKTTPEEIAFAKLITLYDVCDKLENNGDYETAKEMRNTLYIISKVLLIDKN